MNSRRDQERSEARRAHPLRAFALLGLAGLALLPAVPARAATVLPLDCPAGHVPGHGWTDPGAPVARIPTGGALQMPNRPERREGRQRSPADARQQSFVDHLSDELASGLAGIALLVGAGGLIGGVALWAAAPKAAATAKA
jgi:hypothetical protein